METKVIYTVTRLFVLVLLKWLFLLIAIPGRESITGRFNRNILQNLYQA